MATTGHPESPHGANPPPGLCRDILAGLDTAVIVADADNRLTYCNACALSLLGVAATRIGELRLDQLLPELSAGHSHTPQVLNLLAPGQAARPVKVTHISSSVPGQQILSLRKQKNETLPDKQTLLQQHVLATISQAQSSFIQRSSPESVFDFLLPDVLELSESEFGFIAGVCKDTNGRLFGRVYTNSPFPWATLAGSVIAPDDDSVLQIRDFHPLLIETINSEEPYISNQKSMLAEALFHNHRQTLTSLLIIPVIGFDGVTGLLVTGNSKSGYSGELVEVLQPFSGACSGFLRATGELRKRRESQSRLIEEKLAAEQTANTKRELPTTISHELRTPRVRERLSAFARQKILLAEDNPINQLVAIELLEDVGFEVDVSENGKDAVTAALNKDYDLILMDIQMPRMDGLEAARAIRSMGGKLKDIPIIAMTANASNEDIDNSRKAGMNAHVTKPFNVQALLATIAGFIGYKDPGQTLQKADTGSSPATQEPAVPGIDTADGLQRINDNMTAYTRILENFARRYRTLAKDLDNLLANDEWDEAIRLTHTLKGSSGNIGARSLYRLAAEAEAHCRNHNRDALLAMAQALQAESELVTAGILELVANSPTGKPPGMTASLSTPELVAELEQIQQSLGRDIAEAERRLETLCATRLNTATRAALLEVRDSLLCFNLKNVKAQLAQLLASITGTDQHRA